MNLSRNIFTISLASLLLAVAAIPESHARKVKQKLKIETSKNKPSSSKTSTVSSHKESGSNENGSDSFEGIMTDAGKESMVGNPDDVQLLFQPDSISFAGYDKSISASREDFLIVNRSPFLITGIKFRITYLDMKGRMLHSRTLSKKVYVPRKETRKIDIPTWDRQKSYYYYLGNEPRRVATPYQVKITPISYWLNL